MSCPIDFRSISTPSIAMFVGLLIALIMLATTTAYAAELAPSGGKKRLAPSDPAIRMLRLPGQTGVPASVRAVHDGEACFGGTSGGVKFGNGRERECGDVLIGGTTTRVCCDVICTYGCEDRVDGKGTYKGSCEQAQPANCTIEGTSSGSAGQPLQSIGPN